MSFTIFTAFQCKTGNGVVGNLFSKITKNTFAFRFPTFLLERGTRGTRNADTIVGLNSPYLRLSADFVLYKGKKDIKRPKKSSLVIHGKKN